MKKLFTILFLLVSITMLAQTQKTYVKSFPTTSQLIQLDLEGLVEVETWEEPFIRVQAIVSIENGSAEVLKSLMLAGRYQVKTNREGPQQFLISNNRKKKITIGGKQLMETVSYKVFVPQYSQVQVGNQASQNLCIR